MIALILNKTTGCYIDKYMTGNKSHDDLYRPEIGDLNKLTINHLFTLRSAKWWFSYKKLDPNIYKIKEFKLEEI